MKSPQNIHATGLVLSGKGIVLRGPPGAGKSLLALDLLENWVARGKVARLVADDRLDIEVVRGALVMRAPPAIAGMIEMRGRGIVHRPFVAKARVHLVVDLVGTSERLVEEDALLTTIAGIALARCPVPRRGVTDPSHQRLLVLEALSTTDGRRAKTT